jgi:hypothetical protein
MIQLERGGHVAQLETPTDDGKLLAKLKRVSFSFEHRSSV